MRISLLLVLASLSGCLVVPSKTTTTRSLGTARSESQPGIARGLSLTIGSEHGEIIVRAIRNRECKREIYAVTEVTEHRGLRMGGIDDPRAAPLAAVLAPVTLPLSLIVSGLSLVGNMTKPHQKRTVTGIETSACSEPAGDVGVNITLASGEVVERRTDGVGRVTFALPVGEPYHGVITAHAETVVAELKYRRKQPPLTALRDAVTSCAGQQSFTGPLEVRVAVNPAGLPTKVDLDRGDSALTTCITTQIADARFPEAQRQTTLVVPFSLGE